MRLAATISSWLAVAIGSAMAQANTSAPAVTSNPPGAAYIATFPDVAFSKNAYPAGGNVQGSVQAVSAPNGAGVMFHLSLSNLPSTGGPFIYHLHDQPVPEDGNCTRTLAHLDPFQRGEKIPCDAAFPETCQVGDLSGKHGNVQVANSSVSFSATYLDNFASTQQGIGAFFGNRSIVFHFANATRITCANFVAVQASPEACGGGGDASTNSVGPQATPAPTATLPGSPVATPEPAISGRHSNATATTRPPYPVVTAAGHAHTARVVAAAGAAGAAGLVFLL